jgi:hypothetical protein
MAEDAVDTLKEMIEHYLVSDDNKDGLLTMSKEAYFACFKLDIAKLNQLFVSEKKHWETNLAKT